MWMSGPLARLRLDIDILARDDIQLIVEGRGALPGQRPRQLEIENNGGAIASLELAPDRGGNRHRQDTPLNSYRLVLSNSIAFFRLAPLNAAGAATSRF